MCIRDRHNCNQSHQKLKYLVNSHINTEKSLAHATTKTKNLTSGFSKLTISWQCDDNISTNEMTIQQYFVAAKKQRESLYNLSNYD